MIGSNVLGELNKRFYVMFLYRGITRGGFHWAINDKPAQNSTLGVAVNVGLII